MDLITMYLCVNGGNKTDINKKDILNRIKYELSQSTGKNYDNIEDLENIFGEIGKGGIVSENQTKVSFTYIDQDNGEIKASYEVDESEEPVFIIKKQEEEGYNGK